MTNKLTNKKALAIAIAKINSARNEDGDAMLSLDDIKFSTDEVVAKLEGMVAALDNKANPATRKPTEKQKENIALREKILDFFRENPVRLITCTEIGKEIPELNGMNNQRISALMRGLVDAEVVTKITEKGKSLFQLAKSEDAGD